MFYEIADEIREISSSEINPECLTVGCISCEELAVHGKEWHFW